MEIERPIDHKGSANEEQYANGQICSGGRCATNGQGASFAAEFSIGSRALVRAGF